MLVKTFDLGLLTFKETYQFQQKIFEEVVSRNIDSGLIFCRHYPVITLGRSAKLENILIPLDELRVKKIDLYRIERGGDVTYHGPGQLTVYPIFNLKYLEKDIYLFLRNLEEVVRDFLLTLKIPTQTRPNLTGVWVANKKIASLGISIRKWISFHGLSINIRQFDLSNFKLIRPCGMDIEMVSADELLYRKIDFIQAINLILNSFKKVFKGDFLEVSPDFKEEAIYDRGAFAGIR
jgi:lipoate-protein ligase B